MLGGNINRIRGHWVVVCMGELKWLLFQRESKNVLSEEQSPKRM